jgi:hypothetical protein
LTGYVSRALIQELACRFTRQEHGHWSINPAEEIRRIRRGYRNGTLVPPLKVALKKHGRLAGVKSQHFFFYLY